MVRGSQTYSEETMRDFLGFYWPLLLIAVVFLVAIGFGIGVDYYSCTASPLDTFYQGLTCYIRDPITGEVLPVEKWRSIDGRLDLGKE
jgi:hypothetical protein